MNSSSRGEVLFDVQPPRDRAGPEAEFQIARAAELSRRTRMAEMAASAENFLSRTIGISYRAGENNKENPSRR
jgi:hypothetical protein